MGGVCCSERAPGPTYQDWLDTQGRDYQHLNEVRFCIYRVTCKIEINYYDCRNLFGVSIEILSLKQVERSVYLAVTSVPTDSSGIESSFSRLMSEEAERLRVRFISFQFGFRFYRRVSKRFHRVRKYSI